MKTSTQYDLYWDVKPNNGRRPGADLCRHPALESHCTFCSVCLTCRRAQHINQLWSCPLHCTLQFGHDEICYHIITIWISLTLSWRYTHRTIADPSKLQNIRLCLLPLLLASHCLRVSRWKLSGAAVHAKTRELALWVSLITLLPHSTQCTPILL